MSELRAVELSPQGRDVLYWRAHCGSFHVNGYLGTANDYLTDAYLRGSVGGKYPDRVVMSPDVLERFANACARSRRGGPYPHEATVEAVIRYVTEEILGTASLRELRLFGARVEYDKTIQPGTILMFLGDRCAVELSGWHS